MKLSIPTNFDDRLIDGIKGYPVVEIYGKLPSDIIGGGRASYLLSPVSKDRLINHIRYARANGISFNYLLNAACLDNIEFSRSGQNGFNKLLEFLIEAGVTWVTVAVPSLLKLIKKRFPELKVKVSVFAFVDNINRAKMWEELGADAITLESLLVNRDFDALRLIRENVNIELQLLANNNCLLFCPMSPYHVNTQAHASQKNHRTKGFMLDSCFLYCSMKKFLDPSNYLRSDWIRPEDIHVYENLGYTSFKLVERNMPTSLLIKRVKAYSERSFDGNLLELVQNFGHKDDRRKFYNRGIFWNLKYFLKPWFMYPHKLLKIRKLLKTTGVLFPYEGNKPIFYIDNKKLDGFIDFFMSRNCRYINCERCSHCRGFAEQAITINEFMRNKCLKLYEDILNDIYSGNIWGIF